MIKNIYTVIIHRSSYYRNVSGVVLFVLVFCHTLSVRMHVCVCVSDSVFLSLYL